MPKAIISVLCALAVGGLLAGCQTTQDPAGPTEKQVATAPPGSGARTETLGQGTRKPPIRISGFVYRYIERGQIHMYFCQQASCGPGSKVSYTFYGPVIQPDFEAFQHTQQQVFSLLKASLPESTKMTLREPARISDDAHTMFSSTREVQPRGGSGVITMSNLIFSKNITISLISSAADEDMAKRNAARFLMSLLAATSAKPGA